MSSPNPPLREPLSSSPFNSSPFHMSQASRQFWKGRDSPTKGMDDNNNTTTASGGGSPYNPNVPMHPSKRDSIENLRKAEKVRSVKSSTMFSAAKASSGERATRPIDTSVARGSPLRGRFNEPNINPDRSSNDARTRLPSQKSPTREGNAMLVSSQQNTPVGSPIKGAFSPGKSSLSRGGRYSVQNKLEQGNQLHLDALEDESLMQKQLKSVNFDEAPPQIHEYEMATPAPSSTTSSIREGSYDSDEFDEDEEEEEEEESFERGSSAEIEDSFDESLEDTEKTPVVHPDEWRFMHEDGEDAEEEADHLEPASTADHGSSPRQLLPSPMPELDHADAAAEAASERRPLPVPPQTSQGKSLNRPSPVTDRFPVLRPTTSHANTDRIIEQPASFDERLQFLRMHESEERTREAQRQRERRMRRGGPRKGSIDSAHSSQPPSLPGRDAHSVPPDYGSSQDLISRESILRNLREKEVLDEHEEDEEHDGVVDDDSGMRMGSNHSQDRDLPLPSVEEHDEDVEVEVKDEEIDESVDMHSIPEQYPDGSQRALSDVHQFEEYEDDAHQQRYQQPHEDEGIDSGQQTPVPLSSPVRHALDKMNQDEPDVDVYPADSGVGMDTQTSSTLNDSLTDYKQHAKALWEARQAQQNEPPKVDARQQEEEPDEPALVLPETGRQTPDQDDEELEDPGTPESVIRHPVPESDYEYDSEYDYEYSEHEAFSFEFEGEGSPEPEAVPEAIATVKAPGGRYVIRPSLNSADVQTMAAMRREISGPLKRPEEYEQPQEEEYYDEDDNNDITPTLKDADEASPEEQAQAGVEEAKAEREAQEQQAERQRQEEERAERQRQEEERAEDEARQQEDARREAEQQEKEMREQEAREAEAEQQYEEEQEYEPEEEFEDQTPTKSGLKPKPSLVKLDVPVEDEDLTLGLTEEFDKVMTKAMDVEIPPSAIASRKENQGNDNGNAETHTPLGKNGKPKYLMRQATKVVVATSPSSIDPASRRVDGGPGHSAPPRRLSQYTWTTEPWHSTKGRRQSLRNSGAGMKKKSRPSRSSYGSGETIEEELAEGEERGRLFVKVVGTRDIDLPLPRGQKAQFALTLDNGMHCVTTNWLDFGRNAPIGQEFELVVLGELEFQLTLQLKIDPPKPKPVERPASPARTLNRPQKMSTFSRVFGSPKKRKEMEMRMQQEMQHQAELERMRERAWLTQHVDPWERVRPLVAKDGSFARAYISLSEHEKAAFGRPYTTQVACFNEWAVEPTAASATVASRMSKKSPATMSTMPQMQGSRRRPPYRIGNLELQLLYVPKPKGAEDKDMPKSMNAAVRELKEAQEATTKEWKGFLSQQGGDCPYWRRRFFRLHGNKLTAYHESTLQPRATINLNKAVKLVDDRSILTQKETSTKGGGRRRSAFAEDEEGYMFVEEGFRIRFGNGEVIDFYADGAAQKEGWMEMLSQVIGKGSAGSGSPKAWTELVLKRERQLGFKAGNAPGLQKNDASTAPPPRPQTPAPNKAGNAPMNGASAQRMAPPRPATPSASAAASKRPPTPGSRVPRSSLLQTQSSFPNPGPPPPFSPTSPPGTRSGMSPAMRHSQMMAPSHVDAHMRAMQARHQKTKSMMF